MRFAFIPPALPVLRHIPPTGPDWQHELKFDGYRVQVHVAGGEAEIFSKNGHYFTTRFQTIANLIPSIPARSAIIDGEIVAADRYGKPDFTKLHNRSAEPHELTLWCFDLMAFNGTDTRERVLETRQARLRGLLKKMDCPAVCLSGPFSDATDLLQDADRRGLEGIVSKQRTASYRSGDRSGWVKVKTASWRAVHQERRTLSER